MYYAVWSVKPIEKVFYTSFCDPLPRPLRQNLLLCATQSLFLCDSSGAQKASPTLGQPLAQADPKSNPPSYTFIQAWQVT